MNAKLIETTDPKHAEALAEIMLKGGVVGAIWSHHLYFLACNACNTLAVTRMNRIKGRPLGQVFVSPGAVEEAEEFANLKKSKGLKVTAQKMVMSPSEYLAYLYKKFPLAVELYAKNNVPSSVTFATEDGKTIWIAGHMADKSYSKFLETVRNLRKNGKQIIFAGTSLNLRGDNTLTVREFDKVIAYFGDKIDAISVYPKGKSLKKLKYSTSSSVVSFIREKPLLLRIGCISVDVLKKYIPDLQLSKNLQTTRRV